MAIVTRRSLGSVAYNAASDIENYNLLADTSYSFSFSIGQTTMKSLFSPEEVKHVVEEGM